MVQRRRDGTEQGEVKCGARECWECEVGVGEGRGTRRRDGEEGGRGDGKELPWTGPVWFKDGLR